MRLARPGARRLWIAVAVMTIPVVAVVGMAGIRCLRKIPARVSWSWNGGTPTLRIAASFPTPDQPLLNDIPANVINEVVASFANSRNLMPLDRRLPELPPPPPPLDDSDIKLLELPQDPSIDPNSEEGQVIARYNAVVRQHNDYYVRLNQKYRLVASRPGEPAPPDPPRPPPLPPLPK
jgi:hypothetical protein